MRLSQAELGRLANDSHKVVNASLRRFAERSWIAQGYAALEVVDARALRDFVAGGPTLGRRAR